MMLPFPFVGRGSRQTALSELEEIPHIMETSTLAVELGHLKHHVQYPSNRSQVVAACNNMSDVSKEDREWFMKSLPEGTYNSPAEVMNALIAKV
jgi:hypothetical protein